MGEYFVTDKRHWVVLRAQLDATSINITDAGSFYTGTEVETALQEVGTELKVHNLNGWEDASQNTLSWDNTDKEITITPSGTSYYWSDGIRYSISSADTLAISSDLSGVWYWYYDGPTLTVVRNPSHAAVDAVIENKCIVAIVCWNTNDDDTVLLANEMHGCVMSGVTHHLWHDAIGATYREGGSISAYTLNTSSDAAISFDLTDIEFYDEDIEHEIEDAADASGQYEQVLTGDAEIPVLYRDATDGSWTRQAASTLPYISPGGVPKYMRDDGASWSQQDVGNSKFVLYFLFATNDWEFPIQMVQGSATYNTKAGALDAVNTEIVNWGELPSAEFLLMYVFVMKVVSGGTTNLQIVEITDYRTQNTSGAVANPATDHGGLTGLGDVDDHLGYVLLDGTRALTGLWNTGAYGININDADVNVNMTIGLTINQAANDDEILAFKSSDVAHGITGWTETDTYGVMRKVVAASGGLSITGYTEDSIGLYLRAVMTDDITTKTTGTVGAIHLDVYKRLTTGSQDPAANQALVCIASAGDTAWICDKEGDTWQTGDVGATGISAVDGNGLRITDDSDTLGIFVGDGGQVGIGSSTVTGADVYLYTASANHNLIIRRETANNYMILLFNNAGTGGQYGIVCADDGALGIDQRLKNNSFVRRVLTIDTSGGVFIGDSANAKMTQGLTINQGANDDEVLSLKSSDIAHGVTGWTETDTWATFKKVSATAGGCGLTGYTEDSIALYLRAMFTDDITTKATNTIGAIHLDTYKKSGTGSQAPAANQALVCIASAGTTAWICDKEGDTWQTGSLTLGSTELTEANLIDLLALI